MNLKSIKMDKKDKIIEIIKHIINNKGNKTIEVLIDENTDLRNDLGFDSFDLAELTVRIEDEFEVDIFSDGIVNKLGEILIKFNEQ